VNVMAKQVAIDGKGVHYTPLNQRIRKAVEDGADEIVVSNVLGQRFIGDGLRGNVTVRIYGVPGGDLAIFMSGPTVIVHGNAEHAPGNTMDAGKLIIHGNAGDAVAHSMRGGKVFVRGDVGYRVGIHMKAYEKHVPVLVCGGKARDFFGEYMAGGMLVLLGMNARDESQPIAGSFVGAGMHGGVIYVRGSVEPWQCGAEVGVVEVGEEHMAELRPVIEEYATAMGMDADEILSAPFVRISPMSHRPYAKLYASM